MKKKIILPVILLLFSSLVGLAQSDLNKALVLSGDIYGVTSSSGDYHSTSVYLKLKLTNTGKKSIILIHPYLTFGQWERTITWSGYNSYGKKMTFTKEVEGLNPDKLKELAEGLDRENPPQNLTYILESGESLEFSDDVEVETKGDCGVIFGVKGKVEYKFSFIKHHRDPNLLEKLQQRWRKFGHLPVDQNGEFSITSELLK